jgi:serine/threonine-protein kinase
VLGEGGMGAVWRASNLLLDLPVAIKLIRADLDRSTLRARLQIEARSAAKLGHPAIVRVYDVGESELGDPFIVMELMHGQTLAKMISQGRLSAARAVQILLPIIDALAVAHGRGIVHRDLKPDNIMIAEEQQRIQPKILDFGIAKLTDPRDNNHKLTEIGMVVGSPDYMSPEQARGRDDVDGSSDIWAICVVLYEAVTGATPFAAHNYNALLRAIVEDDPKSLVEHAAGDGALWEIVNRGLSKDRRDRQASMSELGRALASWLLSHGIFEDACGTSLESKWFGRNSDHSLGSDESGSPRTVSADFQSKETHDLPNATGIDSPPFTATIRAAAGGRWRSARVALAVALCAAAGVFGLGVSRHHSATAQASTIAATQQPPPPVPEAPATAARVEPAPEQPTEPAAAPTSTPLAVTKAAPAAPPLQKKALLHVGSKPAASAHAIQASPEPSPPVTSAKPTPRPLDLLAPY